jgi:hypothetical protein
MGVTCKYFLPFMLALGLLVLMVIAAASPWYHIRMETGTDVWEYLSHLIRETEDEDIEECAYTSSQCIQGQLQSMYAVILAVVVIDIVFAFVQISLLLFFSLDFTSRFSWRSTLKPPLLIFSGLVVLLSFAAWLIFFWHPHAWKETYGARCHPHHDSPACELVGDRFGPADGWGLFIGVSVTQLLLFVGILLAASTDTRGYYDFMY